MQSLESLAKAVNASWGRDGSVGKKPRASWH